MRAPRDYREWLLQLFSFMEQEAQVALAEAHARLTASVRDGDDVAAGIDMLGVRAGNRDVIMCGNALRLVQLTPAAGLWQVYGDLRELYASAGGGMLPTEAEWLSGRGEG